MEKGDTRDRMRGVNGQGMFRGAPNGGFHDDHRYKMSIKPEPYDEGEDWEEYISHFEICAELGKWHETDKVLALAAALRGPARTFYISLGQGKKRNYAALTQRLGLRFGSTRQQNRWLSRLEMRKRKPGESVAVLADDLRQMSQRAYVDLDARAQEVLALNQLYKSVTPEVKYQCTNQGCETVAEAVEVIERYEAIIGDCSERKKQNVSMTTGYSETEDNHQDHCNGQIQDTLHGLTRRISQLETSRTPPIHNNIQNTRSWHGRSRNNGSMRKTLTCFICDSPDHICRNCPFFLKYKQETGKQENQNRPNIPNRENTSMTSTRTQGNFRSPLTH